MIHENLIRADEMFGFGFAFLPPVTLNLAFRPAGSFDSCLVPINDIRSLDKPELASTIPD